MAHDTTNKPRTVATTGIPFWDMMLSFGSTNTAAVPAAAPATRAAAGVEVIALGAETLHVGTRQVAGDTTRVRRVVVETPTEQAVTLREERVIVERRKPTAATLAHGAEALFTEMAVEMSDTFEVAESWKSARVTEEVVLRREVTTRTETVRDVVRHDELVLEQSSRALPAPRREPAPKAKRDVTVPGVQQISVPTPAQLSADLQKVAERFETDMGEQEKTLATLHETIQSEAHKAEAHIPLQTAADLPKQADKSSRKG